MQTQPQTAEWLSADEIARPLGVSAALIRKMGRLGEIPSLKVRSAVRFPRETLTWLIEQNTRRPARG